MVARLVVLEVHVVVNSVANQEESDNGVHEGSSRGFGAVKVTLFVARNGVQSGGGGGGGSLGQLVKQNYG